MDNESTLTLAKLKAMMRKFDHLMTEDVIGVSYFFPPDKCLVFTDHRGTVYAMGEEFFASLQKHATKPEPDALVHHPFGLPVVMVDNDPRGPDIKARVAKSMKATVDVNGALKRLGLINPDAAS